MRKKFTFKEMPTSDVAKNYADKQLSRIEDYLKHEPTPIDIEMVFTQGRTHAHHHVDLLVRTPHYKLITSYEGPEMYDGIDEVIDTMYRRLLEEKDKRVQDRKMVGRHDDFKKQR
jgi:ribosomal subunit interface protein